MLHWIQSKLHVAPVFVFTHMPISHFVSIVRLQRI